MISVSKIIYLLTFLLLAGCNPVIGVSSFVHSVVTGNTVGIVSGSAGIAVEQTTGKSVTEHVLDGIIPKEKIQKPKTVQWIFLQ